MQLEDVLFEKMKKNPQNTYESLSPITWLLKVFATNSNFEHESCFRPFYFIKAFLTMVVIGSLNIYCLYYKIKYIFDHISPSIKLSDALQMIYDHFQFIVDLWFINKYGRRISVEYFKQYESIDIILGMTDYSTVKWKLARLTCFFSFIWLTSSALDFTAWYFSYGWMTPLMYSIAYIYLYIKILTTLDLTSHIMHVEVRLRMIADLVQQFYSTSENMPGFLGDSIDNKNWLYSAACSRTSHLKSRINPLKRNVKGISDKDFYEINCLIRCYLMLTEQVAFINRMFGLRILLNSLSLLIDIVRFTNIAVRIIIGTQITAYNTGYFPAATSLLRQLTCVSLLISLVDHCEKTYSQKDRILSTIDHLLINKNPNEKLRETMIELRELVKARPINFSMAKFFRLDYSFLISFASAVVTYTIILLQSMN